MLKKLSLQVSLTGVLAIMLGTFGRSLAQPIVPLVYDSKQSTYVGAYDLLFLQKAVYSFQDHYIPDTVRNEKKPLKKALGIGYRMGKLFLLDFQEDFLITLTQHEAFGHCARYREFGSRGNSVKITPFFPFGDGSGSAMYGRVIGNFTPHKNIATSIAGVEANMVLGNTASLNFLQNDSIHYREALIYLIAQNDQLMYIWADRFRPANSNGGGDMKGYVARLNGTYSPFDPHYDMEKLSLQGLVSLVNPIQLYAAYTILYSHGIMGRKYLSHIPMIKLGQARYLPYLNYGLTPFGSEYLFCNVLRYRDKMYTADIGISEGTYSQFYRVKAKTFNIVGVQRAKVNLYAEAWSQPELKLDLATIPGTKNKAGGLIKADIAIAPFSSSNSFNLFAQVGYKTKGFTIGEPLAETFLLRYGMGVRL